MHSHRTAFILLFSFLPILGCAGAFHVGNAWDPAEEEFFDDGLDVLENFDKLSGQWKFKAEKELHARCNLANMIAKVNVTSIQSSRQSTEYEQNRIEVEIEEIFYGESPDKNITLISNHDSKGYNLIERHKERLHGEHMLFIRWFKTEKGETGHHFHLSPASESNLLKIRKMVKERIEEESRPID